MANPTLSQLLVKNFAIVEKLELELNTGLTVLTGETGAGKSILLDAISFVLGARAQTQCIRPGAKRAEVTLNIECSQGTLLQNWLADSELDSGGECILRRTLGSDGRSRAYINDQLVPLQRLRDFGAQLFEIHGQHANQALLKIQSHGQLLDDYGEHSSCCHKVRALARRIAQTRKTLESLVRSKTEREQRAEFLRYQVQELEQLSPQDNEWEQIEQEQRRLANSEELLRRLQQINTLLDDNNSGGVLRSSEQIITLLSNLVNIDAKLQPALELINSAVVQLNELSHDLNYYADHVEMDETRLAAVETRMRTWFELARKHRAEPASLPNILKHLTTELEQITSAAEQSADLIADLNQCEQEYAINAAELSKLRAQTAIELSNIITQKIRTLGMPQAQFEIKCAPVTDPSSCPGDGLEQVQFWVSANPGQPLQPLHKIASGGELARISLAVQVATAQVLQTPIMIFDEVDVGIGGGTAEIVGRMLKTLGEKIQVLCITHQAQVAAQADQHLLIAKWVTEGQTFSKVQRLNAKDRVEELARMLGGLKITAQTRKTAEELLGA